MKGTIVDLEIFYNFSFCLINFDKGRACAQFEKNLNLAVPRTVDFLDIIFEISVVVIVINTIQVFFIQQNHIFLFEITQKIFGNFIFKFLRICLTLINSVYHKLWSYFSWIKR
jgi:hypothetical protein